jgi:hypothetical protein
MRVLLGSFFLVLAVAVLVGLLRPAVRHRGWVRGQATVTDVSFVRADDTSTFFSVRARLRTEDGREVEGLAEGLYDEAGRWPGTRRPGWYDPRRPSSFTLSPPWGQGFLKESWWVMAIAIVFAGVGLALVVL